MLRKVIALVESQASITVDAIDAPAFALELGERLNELASYWQPATETPTESGAEFAWPNGSLVSIERSLGRWFLDTDKELFPLTSVDLDDLVVEIDTILRDTGYAAWLGETKIYFNTPTETNWSAAVQSS